MLTFFCSMKKFVFEVINNFIENKYREPYSSREKSSVRNYSGFLTMTSGSIDTYEQKTRTLVVAQIKVEYKLAMFHNQRKVYYMKIKTLYLLKC